MKATYMRYVPIILFSSILRAQQPNVTLGVDAGLKCDVSSGTTLSNCTAYSQYIDTAMALRISGESTVRRVAAVNGAVITLDGTPAASGKQVSIYKVVDSIDHGSLRVFLTSSPAAYVAVAFGTSPSSYPYRTYQGYTQTSNARIAVGGLNPATTYYFRIIAKPKSGSSMSGICNSEACGSTEFSVTTSVVSGPHPTQPSPPANWVPPVINTTGYKVFPVPAFADGAIKGSVRTGSSTLTVSGKMGLAVNHWIRITGTSCGVLTLPLVLDDCQIASISGNTITLTHAVNKTVMDAAVSWSAYTISDFLYANKPYTLPYGTLILFAQGYRAPWYPVNNGNGSSGMNLAAKPPDSNCGGVCTLDDPRHRWIVFDTAPGPATLQPLSLRADPAVSSILGGLVLQQPGPNSGDLMVLDGSGFNGYAGPPHHYAIRRLVFTTTASLGDGTDPQQTQALVGFNGSNPSYFPQYVIVDGDYIAGATPRVRLADGIGLAGGHIAIQNNFVVAEYWRPGQPLNQSCTVSSNKVTISKQTWKANKSDSGYAMPSSVVYSVSGSSGYAGGIWVGLKSNGALEAHYLASSAGGSLSVSCSGAGCGAEIPETTINTYGAHPSFWNQSLVPVCAVGINGSTPTSPENFADSVWNTEGSHALNINDGPGPIYIANNYFEGYGINFFTDIGSSNGPSLNDVVFLRNQFVWKQDHRRTSSNWNGFNYRVRNLWETKRGRRWILDGNEFSGQWANVNAGDSILLSGRFSTAGCNTHGAPSREGISDIEIRNNFIHDGAAGIYVQGGNAGVPGAGCGPYHVGDPPLTSRVHIHDNLITGINSITYQDNPPSHFIGEFIRALNGPVDLTVSHNTVWNLLGDYPTQLFVSGIAGEGLEFRDNIMHLNIGSNGGGGIMIDASEAVPGFSYLPPVNTNNYATQLASAFPRLGGSPAAAFKNNVIIGGAKANGSDMSQSDINNYASGSGSFYNSLASKNQFPSGGNRNAREERVKLRATGMGQFVLRSDSDYISGAKASSDGYSVGANVDSLNDRMGIITNVRELSITPSGATIAFHAPDPGTACYVTFGQNNILENTWSLTVADTTASQERNIAISGLMSSKAYFYKVACAGGAPIAIRSFQTH